MIEYDADMEPGQFYYTLKKRVEKYFAGNQVGCLMQQSLAGCCAIAASMRRAGCKTWVVAAMLSHAGTWLSLQITGGRSPVGYIHDMFASHSCSCSVWPPLAVNTELTSRCRTGWATASGSRMHTMGYWYCKHVCSAHDRRKSLRTVDHLTAGSQTAATCPFATLTPAAAARSQEQHQHVHQICANSIRRCSDDLHNLLRVHQLLGEL